MPRSLPEGITAVAIKEIGKNANLELQSGIKARRGLKDRWEANEAIIRVEDGASSSEILKGVRSHEIPLVLQKVNRISGVVHGALTNIEPFVQLISYGGDDPAADLAENDLHFLIKIAGYERHLWNVLKIAGATNIALLRLMYVDGQGFQIDVVHPGDFAIYPSRLKDIEQAKLVGHKFKRSRAWIKGEIDAKRFFAVDAKSKLVEGDFNDPAQAGRNPTFDKDEGDDDIVDPMDAQIELWELYIKEDFDKTGRKWWRMTLAPLTMEVLSLEPWGATKRTQDVDGITIEEFIPYPIPPYFDVRYDDEYGKFYPSTSPAQNLQGIQQLYTDLVNTLSLGQRASAFPITIVSGGGVAQKIIETFPGMLLQYPTEVKVQSIQQQFNPGVMPEMVVLMERVADAVTGISQLGSARQLKQDTTATEVNFLGEMQRQAEDRYTTFATVGLQRFWEWAFTLYKTHHQDILDTFQAAIQLTDAALLEGRHHRVEVNGRATSNSPNILIGKLQFLYAIAISPIGPVVGLDPMKIVQQIVSALQLPFNTAKIKLSQSPASQMSNQGPMALPGAQPPMGMDQGVPGQAPDLSRALSSLVGLLGGQAGMVPGAGMPAEQQAAV